MVLNDQIITIETCHFLNNSLTWIALIECINREPIPNLPHGTVVFIELLECKQTLATEDPNITSELYNLTVFVNGTENTFLCFRL